MTESLRRVVGRALPVQVTWAILAAIWNFAGVYLIVHGQRAIGPTGSIAGGVALMVFAAAYIVTVSRWPMAYLLLTIVAGLVAAGAVVNAFTANPALWPSESWRYAGALLNGVGFFAALAAVVPYVRWRASR